MIIYFIFMRTRDEIKLQALRKATVQLVNETGFAQSSVSKIAKKAGISPATLYIYYKNKEDLLVSTYIEIKKNMGRTIQKDFNPDSPIRDIMKTVWFNMFEYIEQYPDNFHYSEQFANSPYQDLVQKNEIEKYFAPLIETIHRGIEQKIIKDVHFDILKVFIFMPILSLANKKICQDLEINRGNLETAFTLAWDAIKL